MRDPALGPLFGTARGPAETPRGPALQRQSVLVAMEPLRNLTTALKEGMRTISPSCRDVTRLQSLALDQSLPVAKQVGLRLHLLLCKWCRRYGKQIRFLRRAVREHQDKTVEPVSQSLTPEARAKLKRSLQGELK